MENELPAEDFFHLGIYKYPTDISVGDDRTVYYKPVKSVEYIKVELVVTNKQFSFLEDEYAKEQED